MDNEKMLSRHIFTFNRTKNSGEHLRIITEIYDSGDGLPDMFMIQKLELNSYENHASINLYGDAMTPEKLRNLADELEMEISFCKGLYSRAETEGL